MSVTITEFTDPLCTWCWGAEPVIRRLEETYGDQVRIEFVMGGLVADFDSFRDEANGITKPADVAGHWEDAAERHGMPVDPAVWRADPPRSSYPACIAYEAAELQGTGAAHRYLRRLREAVATERRNIADREVLIALAEEAGLDEDRFRAAIAGDRARAAFEEDRAYTRERGVRAFPTFRIEAGAKTGGSRGPIPSKRSPTPLRQSRRTSTADRRGPCRGSSIVTAPWRPPRSQRCTTSGRTRPGGG